MVRLLVIQKGTPVDQGRFFVLRDQLRIGRHPTNEISVGDLAVSRHHATIEATGDGVIVRDLKSGNGTFINGQKLDGEKPLATGDVVRVGATELRFESKNDDVDANANAETPMPGGGA